MVEKPPGRRDQDVGAALERVELRSKADAAINRRNRDVRMFSERREMLGDLIGEFAGRSENECARLSARLVHEPLQYRKPKAAVLPLPVSALPRTSRPSRAGGIARAWIGVGSEKPRSSRAASNGGCKPSFSKVEMIDDLSRVCAARSHSSERSRGSCLTMAWRALLRQMLESQGTRCDRGGATSQPISGLLDQRKDVARRRADRTSSQSRATAQIAALAQASGTNGFAIVRLVASDARTSRERS